MAYEIPLTREELIIPDELIPNNSKAQVPVKFHLSPAADADQARVKSILIATTGLAGDGAWSPEAQKAIISAFKTGADLFVRTVEKIDGLTVPGWVAKKHALLPAKDFPSLGDKAPFSIETGAQFSQVYGYVLSIALLVAFHIGKLSNQAEGIDPRFFGLPSGSFGTATPGGTPTTAPNARSRRGKRATAASKSKG